MRACVLTVCIKCSKDHVGRRSLGHEIFMTSHICNKHVIRLYFTAEIYKLYQFALPFITKAEHLFLILRKLIFLKINVFFKKLYIA